MTVAPGYVCSRLRRAVRVCDVLAASVTALIVAVEVTSGAAVASTVTDKLPAVTSPAVSCRVKVQVVLTAAASVVAAHVGVVPLLVTARSFSGTGPAVTATVHADS